MGGMRDMFVGSGLFMWEPCSFNASPGDIYLDEENHTAMCIQSDGAADLLGEFSIAETGGIAGALVGALVGFTVVEAIIANALGSALLSLIMSLIALRRIPRFDLTDINKF